MRLLPGGPPETPPQTIEGAVGQVLQNPPRVVIREAPTGAQWTVPVDRNTVLTRNLQGSQAQPASLAEVRVGDYAQATGVRDKPALRIVFTYGQAAGRIVSLVENTITLSDGSTYRLSDDVRVLDVAGRPLALQSLVKNSAIQVTFSPRSRVVYELRVTALPPRPQETTLEGPVVQVLANPPRVVLQGAAPGAPRTIPVDEHTILTRNVQGSQAQPARLTDVRPGDYAEAVLVQGDPALRIAFTYGQAAGKVVALTAGTLTLDDGSSYRLSDEVRVLDPAGKPASPETLVKNTTVEVIFTTRLRVAYEVRITAPPPTQGQPEIQGVVLLNKTVYFKRGDVVKLQLRGTPAGTATASIGRLVSDLPLPEVKPGVYQADYALAGRQSMRSQPVTGDLTVGGERAPSFVSQARVVIDNTPPALTGKLPVADAVISNTSPIIELNVGPAGLGAPLDLANSHLWVNDREVTEAVRGGQDRLTFLAQDLPAGPVAVKAQVRDLAGNETEVAWSFTIAPVADNPLLAVYHDASSTLVTGSVLGVTARVLQSGGVATFDLGKLRARLPMRREGNTDLYRGSYTVQDGDEAEGAAVIVKYRDPRGRQGAMEATTRVEIDSKLPTALAITGPEDQSKVGEVIVATGQAIPNTRVRVVINYASRALPKLTALLWQGTVITNARGVWQTPEIGSSPGTVPRADQYIIMAKSLDAAGNVAEQKQVTLRRQGAD